MAQSGGVVAQLERCGGSVREVWWLSREALRLGLLTKSCNPATEGLLGTPTSNFSNRFDPACRSFRAGGLRRSRPVIIPGVPVIAL
jgi:hypothetical protein